jgi:YD repeat-containing protein
LRARAGVGDSGCAGHSRRLRCVGVQLAGAGALTSEIYPSGRTVTNSYDAADPRSLRLAADEVRLVLQRVSDVRAQESAQASGASNPDQLQHEMQHAVVEDIPEKQP